MEVGVKHKEPDVYQPVHVQVGMEPEPFVEF